MAVQARRYSMIGPKILQQHLPRTLIETKWKTFLRNSQLNEQKMKLQMEIGADGKLNNKILVDACNNIKKVLSNAGMCFFPMSYSFWNYHQYIK